MEKFVTVASVILILVFGAGLTVIRPADTVSTLIVLMFALYAAFGVFVFIRQMVIFYKRRHS
ncbi:MAG: hypothetical protein LBN97_06000 [Oscillospiraceae bacterium]|jgi:hypothetical protein|nr:hypothetical protein [Oscillospiraceae bacterium]